MTPAATLSATALATAAWAGPNICTACLAPLMVTLVISTVAGLQIRLGVEHGQQVRVARASGPPGRWRRPCRPGRP